MKTRKVANRASTKSAANGKVAVAKTPVSAKNGTKSASSTASSSATARKGVTAVKGPVAKASIAKIGAKTTVTKTTVTKFSAQKAVVEKNGAVKNDVVKNGIGKNGGDFKSMKKGPVIPGATVTPIVPKVPTVQVNFRVGDKVVYPAHGVGIIDDIQTRKISTAEQSFYMLTVVETGMKIMVPTSQVETVGLRKVVDSKTIDKVYDILRDRNVVTDTQTWNRRYREYTQKIKTGSVFEIASVIRDLIVLKGDKELSFGERKMLDTAQGLLVKEISIAKARSEDTVRAELLEMFQAV